MTEHESLEQTGHSDDDALTASSLPSFLQGPHEVHDAPEENGTDSEVETDNQPDDKAEGEPQCGETCTPESDISPEESAESDAEQSDRQDEPSLPAATARALSSFLSDGVQGVKAVNAARKARSDAQAELERLERSIAQQRIELDHRTGIEARYEDILRDEKARKAAALTQKESASAEKARLEAEAARLKEQLEAMKNEDDATERRLKSALDAASAKEASERESGARLQRRVDDATRNLDRAKRDRAEGVEAAQKAMESARAHLDTLKAEYTELQRNPSANPAEYTVRTNELQAEISDAAEALRNAQGELPRVDRDTELSIDAAAAALREAKKPIDRAKKQFDEAAGAVDRARDTYEDAREDADARQKELRRQIAERTKGAKEQEKRAQAAQSEADAAQAAIDEAEEIHAHPELTAQIEGALENDTAEHADRAREVEELASAERTVRDQTRGTRLRFISAVVSIIVFLVLMLAWTFIAR